MLAELLSLTYFSLIQLNTESLAPHVTVEMRIDSEGSDHPAETFYFKRRIFRASATSHIKWQVTRRVYGESDITIKSDDCPSLILQMEELEHLQVGTLLAPPSTTPHPFVLSDMYTIRARGLGTNGTIQTVEVRTTTGAYADWGRKVHSTIASCRSQPSSQTTSPANT